MLLKKMDKIETIVNRWEYVAPNCYVTNKCKKDVIYHTVEPRIENIKRYKRTEVYLQNKPLVECVLENTYRIKDQRACVVCRMSEYGPGLVFLSGEDDVERDLCNVSCLYNLIGEPKLWKSLEDGGLYSSFKMNTYFYCLDVGFQRYVDSPIEFMDVMSIGQEDAKSLRLFEKSEKKIEIDILQNMFVAYAAPRANGADTLIIDDFGCHKNDYSIYNCAKYWHDMICTGFYRGLYRKIIFAISNKKSYKIFRRVFEDGEKGNI